MGAGCRSTRAVLAELRDVRPYGWPVVPDVLSDELLVLVDVSGEVVVVVELVVLDGEVLEDEEVVDCELWSASMFELELIEPGCDVW